jgi:hypothetical protein
MNAEDEDRLAELRNQFHLGADLNHLELSEMLKLQGRKCRELGMSVPVQSDLRPDDSPPRHR